MIYSGMFKRILFIFVVLLNVFTVYGSSGTTGEAITFSYLLWNLDREVAGLFDCYFEAVPECPVRQDTPVRLWLLDLAWLRATAAFQEAQIIEDGVVPYPDLVDPWQDYIQTTEEYITFYEDLRNFYHDRTVTELDEYSLILEDSLICIDSIWLEKHGVLFSLLSEKGLI